MKILIHSYFWHILIFNILKIFNINFFNIIGSQIISKYGSDSSINSMLNKLDIVIMPVLNVDGYAYTWNGVSMISVFDKNTTGGYYWWKWVGMLVQNDP